MHSRALTDFNPQRTISYKVYAAFLLQLFTLCLLTLTPLTCIRLLLYGRCAAMYGNGVSYIHHIISKLVYSKSQRCSAINSGVMVRCFRIFHVAVV